MNDLNTYLKLAITKIGDLLLRDKITQDKDGKAIHNVHLEIPNYQRPYKWTAKNVTQLLDDIIHAKNEHKEAYRVGTLILHQDEHSKNNIVDGQQRLITFSLLLKALDASPIKFLEQPITDNPHNRTNIPNNFRTLARRINNIKEEKDRATLQDYIENNCEFIVIITNDISEAFQFFDSQNARGKKLYPHDLLKAYHLREISDLDADETEKIVKSWEDLDQQELSSLFSDYLYRVKEWIKGNEAWELTEQNIQIFKGINRDDNYPFAQFYKGAYAYADTVNNSTMPFVSGIQNLKPFQLDTPIIAGNPFFEYTKYYYYILKDIQNNNKYEGYLINDNDIIKTLDQRIYKKGVGNRITRLIFDTAILLYVDRFCPERPTETDLERLDQFVLFNFVWAYSLRAQYYNLGWQSAQNYILGNDRKNSFNMYRIITETDSPVSLLSILSDMVEPLPISQVKAKKDNIHEQDEIGIYKNYLHYFKINNFLEA